MHHITVCIVDEMFNHTMNVIIFQDISSLNYSSCIGNFGFSAEPQQTTEYPANHYSIVRVKALHYYTKGRRESVLND